MDAVTYPHDDVIAALGEGFATYKINMLERHPDFREACAGARVMWGPTFVIADGRGLEVRRWTGWLAPRSFVAELAFCRAFADYTHGKFAESASALEALAESAGGTEIHPEAIYWLGAAGFMAGKQDWAALGRAWRRVVAEFPGSRWAAHASVIEDTPI